MDCPKCIGKLGEVSIRIDNLAKAATDELNLDQCFVCGGVWFDAGELEKYLADKLTFVDSPSVGEDLRKELDQKTGKCPRCGVAMSKQPAPKDSSVTIDCCPKCRGIWLDNTEVDRLEDKKKTGVSMLEGLRARLSHLFYGR